ncbi:MAG: helix-turn-helix transcriptional regulator [Ruminococcaceae bacterium]|nr:helix-turn-helix transcriptional regulator [Oscillospiraceae bacterium]
MSYLSRMIYDIMSLGDIMKNNLKLLRKEKGLTQIALQMKTGIEQALLSKFETGERTPPTETLLVLAEFYDVSIDYILCRTDNPKINK